MDHESAILICLLLLQMILTLLMLNPVFDVHRLTSFINSATKKFKRSYLLLIGAYFIFLIYLGMFRPMQYIQALMFGQNLNALEKLSLLSRIEKNYIIAGFSLFLVVVLYGIRALLSYTAHLAQLTKACNTTLVVKSIEDRDRVPSNLLKIKRSISCEAVLCMHELKEQLQILMKNYDLPPSQTFMFNNFMLDTKMALLQ